jgi:uncharacterized membrane protein YedE/YeeE
MLIVGAGLMVAGFLVYFRYHHLHLEQVETPSVLAFIVGFSFAGASVSMLLFGGCSGDHALTLHSGNDPANDP